MVDNVEILEADDVNVHTLDKLVSVRVSIVRGGEKAKGVMNSRAQDEYAVVPDFGWWAREILRKWQRILSKLGKLKYWRTTKMIRIKVPKTVEGAQWFDYEMGILRG